VQDHPVFELSSEIVDELAALFPEVATEVGIAGFDGEWSDLSPEGAAQTVARLRSLHRRVEELPEPGSDWDRVAIALARTTLAEEADHFESDDHLRDLNSIASPLQGLTEVWDHMGRESAADWESIASRLERLPAAIDGYRRALDRGRQQGLAVAVRQVRAAAEQCRVAASPESRVARLPDEYERQNPDRVMLARLEAGVTGARQAFGSLADYLVDGYATDAAESDAVGPDRYRRAAFEFLGTNLDLRATYEWGWSQVAEIATDMEKTAVEISPGASIGRVTELLKTDPARTVPDADGLKALIQERLDDALSRLAGLHFDVPEPIRRLTVQIAPPGGSLGAYYVGPSEDFTRPGSVWWSLTPQGPYPTFDEVSTAYHEGFPGHHLQIGIQMSHAEQLSRLHRLWVWKAGTGEGWALYAERFMNELGFFEKPEYVFGWLSGQMLRACRVVIDIGSHLELPIPADQEFHPGERWTFETAVEMLESYATLSRPNAESEVTRYLGWPGQAIAYKVGEKAILELRDEVKARRGPTFDVKQFHSRLLEVGPVGLDLLRAELIR
jgi:uncharacterized protein (DUF885 family)